MSPWFPWLSSVWCPGCFLSCVVVFSVSVPPAFAATAAAVPSAFPIQFLPRLPVHAPFSSSPSAGFTRSRLEHLRALRFGSLGGKEVACLVVIGGCGLINVSYAISIANGFDNEGAHVEYSGHSFVSILQRGRSRTAPAFNGNSGKGSLPLEPSDG